MNQNETLYQAYLLKEQISDIMDEPEVSTAITRMEEWLKNVINAGIDPITKAAKVLFRHLDGILYYLEYRVTNAGSEGFNNKINIIKRRAYGYKDIGYFILKIYQSCGVMKSWPKFGEEAKLIIKY